MFEAARSLVLKDRSKARKALADEIKRNESDELDAELDQLEREENERLAAEQAETTRALRAADVRKEILQIQTRQHDAAKAFDAALTSANAAFEQLEQLAADTAKLERELGGDGKRPVIAGYTRTTALVSAMWNSARPLSKRLRLSVVPGGPSKIKPLNAVYAKIEKE